jgi:RNA polymerase sigma factor (TIGR02999 family)
VSDPALPPDRVTQLLSDLATGEEGAADELMPLIYGDLRRLAQRQLSGERAGHTLEPTALVHEAWMRLRPDHAGRAESRDRYFALAARIMRSILVDHARRRGAAKRGGDAERVTLSGVGDVDAGVDVLELHDALERLAETDEELARIAELHVFAGMTQGEVASALGIAKRTLDRRWRVASAWLRKELGA